MVQARLFLQHLFCPLPVGTEVIALLIIATTTDTLEQWFLTRWVLPPRGHLVNLETFGVVTSWGHLLLASVSRETRGAMLRTVLPNKERPVPSVSAVRWKALLESGVPRMGGRHSKVGRPLPFRVVL